MKILKLSLIIAIVTTAFAFALVSCKTDPCEKVGCNITGGVLTPDGSGKLCSCVCKVGYYGDSCSKLVKDFLTGTTWLPVSVMAAGGEQLKACDQDDNTNFTTNGKLITTRLGTKCDPAEAAADTTTYTISNDAKTLTIAYKLGPTPTSIAMTISELTSSSLKASATSPLPISVVFKAK